MVHNVGEDHKWCYSGPFTLSRLKLGNRTGHCFSPNWDKLSWFYQRLVCYHSLYAFITAVFKKVVGTLFLCSFWSYRRALALCHQECSCDPVNFVFYNYTGHKLIQQNLSPPAWKVHSEKIRLYTFRKTRNSVEKHPEMVLEGGCLRWVGASNWPVEHSM